MDDNFLSLGGDSILATQVVSRMRQSLDVELSLLTFFNARTLSELAEAVEAVQVAERAV
jgi:acyl carrier protein